MRLTLDQWAMGLATQTAKRSTCCRRSVGCVLLNSKGHVLATGYNGVAAGQLHCNEPAVGSKFPEFKYPNACKGAFAKSGTELDACKAIHAEQNALLQCQDVSKIHSCYVTASPCMTCTKLLLNTGCQRIIFLEEYPSDSWSLWVDSGRDWINFNQS